VLLYPPSSIINDVTLFSKEKKLFLSLRAKRSNLRLNAFIVLILTMKIAARFSESPSFFFLVFYVLFNSYQTDEEKVREVFFKGVYRFD